MGHGGRWRRSVRRECMGVAVMATGALATAGAASAAAAPQRLDVRALLRYASAGDVQVGVTEVAPFGGDTVLVSRPAPGGREVTAYNRRGVLVFRWNRETVTPIQVPTGDERGTVTVEDHAGTGRLSGGTGAYTGAGGDVSFDWHAQPPQDARYSFEGNVDLGRPGPATRARPLRAGTHAVHARAQALHSDNSADGTFAEYAGVISGAPFRAGDALLIELPAAGRRADGVAVVFGADGSRLEATLHGTQSPGSSGGGGASVAATATMTSGTGRFAGFRGRLRVRARPSGQEADTSEYTITGALSRKAPRGRRRAAAPRVTMRFRAGVAKGVEFANGVEYRVGQGRAGARQGVLRFAVRPGGRWTLVDYLPRGTLFASGTDTVTAVAGFAPSHVAAGRVTGGTGIYRGASGAFGFSYQDTADRPDTENLTVTYAVDAVVQLRRTAPSRRGSGPVRTQRVDVASVLVDVFGGVRPPGGAWRYGIAHGAPLGANGVLLEHTTGRGRGTRIGLVLYDSTGTLHATVGPSGIARFAGGTGRYRRARGTARFAQSDIPSVPQHRVTLTGSVRF